MRVRIPVWAKANAGAGARAENQGQKPMSHKQGPEAQDQKVRACSDCIFVLICL